MKIKKCLVCKIYTLKDKCPKCQKETSIAGYKFREKFKNNLSKASNKRD